MEVGVDVRLFLPDCDPYDLSNTLEGLSEGVGVREPEQWCGFPVVTFQWGTHIRRQFRPKGPLLHPTPGQS